MNRILVSTQKFEKAYKRFVKSYPFLQQKIDNALLLLENDLFTSNLYTHKLSGDLHGFYACSCGFDCRIVFSIKKDLTKNQELIILLDIGTHEDVY